MQKEKAPLGLYIHIPFCRQKCAYCDFYSLPRSEEKMDAYTAALLRHIEEVAPPLLPIGWTRCTSAAVPPAIWDRTA